MSALIYKNILYIFQDFFYISYYILMHIIFHIFVTRFLWYKRFILEINLLSPATNSDFSIVAKNFLYIYHVYSIKSCIIFYFLIIYTIISWITLLLLYFCDFYLYLYCWYIVVYCKSLLVKLIRNSILHYLYVKINFKLKY